MGVSFLIVYEISQKTKMDSYITLNSGYRMPILGLGQISFNQLKNRTYLSPESECESAVEAAIRNGYRLIDTASVYKNERAVGRAIKKCIDEGIVKREDLFITTKLWCPDWKTENVAKSVSQSLANLQTDYIDLYLIHMAGFYNLPDEDEKHRQEGDFFDYPYSPPNDPKYRLGYKVECVKEAWKGLENAVKEGKVRSIGVSNFSTKKVEELLSFCSIPPAMNQVELHPYLQQWDTIETLEKKGVKMTAFFPLGGFRNMNNKNEVPLIKDPRILEIAKNHNKTAAQVLIRWAIQRGTVCIPKSVHENRIKENFDVFDFELTPEEMEKIRAMDRGTRFSDVAQILFSYEISSQDYWDGEYC